MTTWLEFYYIGKDHLMPSSQLDSSVLSVGLVESSNDPLEPPSGEPVSIKDLEQALTFYRLATQHAAAHGLTVVEWMERAAVAMQVVDNIFGEALEKKE